MTGEQLEQLRRMTPKEIMTKYTPLLLKGEIDKDAYEWLLSQGSKIDLQDPYGKKKHDWSKQDIEELTEQFQTTHTEVIKGLSQKARLLILLKDGKWHTNKEIVKEVYGQDGRTYAHYQARVLDLKNDGHDIEGKWIDKKQGLYAYKLKI
jgi:hypothetical protein